jgi:LETM1-like protein
MLVISFSTIHRATLIHCAGIRRLYYQRQNIVSSHFHQTYSIATNYKQSVPRPTLQQRRCRSRLREGTSDPLAATLQQQPMTLWERTKSFSNGVYRLYQDYVLYSNIHESARTAVKTHLHNWSKRSMLRQSMENSLSAIIPWRQQAQQRQFLSGFYTVAPVVTLFMLPVVGYLPMLLSIVLPRQLLSRHFYNEYEILHYNQLAYQQRLPFYKEVQWFWPKQIARSTGDGTDPASSANADLFTFYQTYFMEERNSTSAKHSFSLAGLDRYPRDYLIALALSSGLYSTLPAPLPHWSAANGTPTWVLRRFLRQLAHTIAHDDTVLLHEEHIMANSSGARDVNMFVDTMTTVELMDACLLRGLPIVHVSKGEMRTALSQHLQIIAEVRKIHVPSPVVSENVLHQERIGLFAVHLPILRQNLAETTLNTSRKMQVL